MNFNSKLTGIIERNAKVHIPGPKTAKGNVIKEAMGSGTLGRAWMYTGEINILDSLDEAGFLKVLHHEQKHLRKPHISEYQVRWETRQELPNDHVGWYGL